MGAVVILYVRVPGRRCDPLESGIQRELSKGTIYKDVYREGEVRLDWKEQGMYGFQYPWQLEEAVILVDHCKARPGGKQGTTPRVLRSG